MRTTTDEFLTKLFRVQEIIIGANYYSIIVLANFVEPNLIYDSIRKAWDFTDEHTLTEAADKPIECLTIIRLLNDILKNTKGIKIKEISIIVILSLIPFDPLYKTLILEIEILFLLQSKFWCVMGEVFRLNATILVINRL